MSSFRFNPIRIAFAVAAIVSTLAAISFYARPKSTVSAASEPRQPILVELFTSEGCSSCPPADDILAKLDSAQPVPGAQIIVLSEHVTYWNSLGWHDPFSSEAMTERQNQYSNRFGLGEVYTPQAVVDGAQELVGSDERKLTRTIAQRASTPKTPLTISDAHWSGNSVRFSVQATHAPESNLVAALAEESAQSSVARGENGGRTLRHVAVVRTLQSFGSNSTDGRPLSLTEPAKISGPVRLVVFLTDRRNGHVIGATEQTLQH